MEGWSLADIAGFLAVVGSLITAIVALKRSSIDNRAGVVTHFKTLVDTYLAEINRLHQVLEEKEQQRLKETEELKEEISNLLSNHKQEIANIKAQHIQEIARIDAEHMSEISGLKVALDELRDLTVEQAARIITREKLRNIGRQEEPAEEKKDVH